MRSIVSTTLDVLGVACLAVAGWLLVGLVGVLVVVGVACLVASWAVDR